MANKRIYVKCSCGAELYIFDGNMGLRCLARKAPDPMAFPSEERLNDFYETQLEYVKTPDWEADNG